MAGWRTTFDVLTNEFLNPARVAYDEIVARVKDAEFELETMLRSREYDDGVAESLQLELEDLRRKETRAHRRVTCFEGALNTKGGDDIVFISQEVR